MKLKNNIIVALAQVGALNLNATALDAAHAYKVIKFRRAISKAFGELQEAEKGIIKDCGLEISADGKLEGPDEAKEKFAKLQKELYEDEADLGDIKTIPYEQWHALKKENKGLADAFVEDSLEEVLWNAPEEE